MAIRRSGRSADGQPTSPCPTARLCGTAVTVLLRLDDNWMLHLATRQLKPGDVVVAAWSTECEDGFFGELLATSMRAWGGIGLVLDRCRYGAAPKPMKFRVLAGRQLQGHGQGHPGLGRAPTVGANALVNPGDVVVGPTLDGRHRRGGRRPRRMRWRCRRSGPPSPRCAGA
jgi:regulator of RNase E activity RraA